MKNSETGEYEVVMGNRQLLSGFFIVALLFGVAFAMGYIVGRNASPGQKGAAEAFHAPPQEQRPAASAPAAQAPEPPKTEAEAAPPAPAPDGATVQTAAARTEEPAPVEPAAEESSELAPGTYWQVIAVARAEAESVRKVLREKNFRVTLSPGSKNLTRVIVGPYPNRESLGKAKSELENAGFNPIVLKK